MATAATPDCCAVHTIQIFYKNLKGKSIALRVTSDQKVGQITAIIRELEGGCQVFAACAMPACLPRAPHITAVLHFGSVLQALARA